MSRKPFWQQWSTKSWIAKAAQRLAKEQAAKAEAEEKIRLKLSKPLEPTKKSGPVVALIEPEFEIQRPTRAEVLTEYPYARGPRF